MSSQVSSICRPVGLLQPFDVFSLREWVSFTVALRSWTSKLLVLRLAQIKSKFVTCPRERPSPLPAHGNELYFKIGEVYSEGLSLRVYVGAVFGVPPPPRFGVALKVKPKRTPPHPPLHLGS